MRCLESLARVQAASFAAGSGGERRDVRGCGGRGYPELLRAPTAAPIPVPPLRASEPSPTRSRLRSPHISSMHGGETRPPPLPQPPPITFRPCTKHPCTSWTPIPSHSHGLSSAGAALLCSACSSTGAAPVPPLPFTPPSPRFCLRVSHCFPDSFAESINTTKNNFRPALTRSQQRGSSCTPRGEGWAPCGCVGGDTHRALLAGLLYLHHLQSESPGLGQLLAGRGMRDARGRAAVPG